MAMPHGEYLIAEQVNITRICLSTPLAPGALCHTAVQSEDVLPGLEVIAHMAVPHTGLALSKVDLVPEWGWNGDALPA
jgi:hypothetical protein